MPCLDSQLGKLRPGINTAQYNPRSEARVQSSLPPGIRGRPTKRKKVKKIKFKHSHTNQGRSSTLRLRVKLELKVKRGTPAGSPGGLVTYPRRSVSNTERPGA